ncbi:guanylate kinase [Candidatus Daviesbacteria bacterium]|nr:guanylate kinase [Candidatus Daviesbacteria bacterium]
MSHPLIILTGKTASGKDTVMAKLLLQSKDIKRIVTTTSRTPRAGEKNGVDYNFISESDFRQKAEDGNFVEWVEYGGNLYGTEKTQIMNNLDSGLIWRIDPSRAGQIKGFIGKTFNQNISAELLERVLVIYLTVDDPVILQRLKKRGLSEEEIDKRMTEDKLFWQQYHDAYDYVVENITGRLDETVDKIVKIIQNHGS